jgi:hypothetical protein
MREEVIKRGIDAGHLRKARKEEVDRLVVHPTFLQVKKTDADGIPVKYRDIINFKKELNLAR